jgi:hypothetical protein
MLAGWALLLFTAIVVLESLSFAQTQQDDRAIEAGREALAGSSRYPWYDSENDAIRRINARTPKEAAAHRNSTWQPPQADLSWLEWLLKLFGRIVYWMFWALMIALLALLIVMLARAYTNTVAAGALAEEEIAESRSEADLIENLPFEVKRPHTDLLGAAQRHYEQGNYGEAIIYLFSYQLVQLDRYHLIRLTRGKTNRQYLREVGPRLGLREMLQRTMVAFEDVFFGHHPLDRERFESCWSRLAEFHERLQRAAI